MKNKINIIAEIAQGYEGNYEQSKLFIKAAANSGANAVKFQLVYADELATKDYQYYELFKKLEMQDSQWKSLNDYACNFGMKLILDIFGSKSLKIAERLGIDTIKVHGTDVTNMELLREIKNSSIKSVILGIGGSYLGEIKNAIQVLKRKHLILLCGFQGYPTKTQDNQIMRMKSIKEKIKSIHPDFQMGFADHTELPEFSSTLSLVAIGAGAQIIEKHLTLGKIMKMEDFESALNPDEFYDFVNQLKAGEQALGEIEKKEDFGMSNSEKKYRENVRRDVVAKKDIKKGEILNAKNLTLKRTSNPRSIKQMELIIGKKVNKGIKKNQPLIKRYIDQI